MKNTHIHLHFSYQESCVYSHTCKYTLIFALHWKRKTLLAVKGSPQQLTLQLCKWLLTLTQHEYEYTRTSNLMWFVLPFSYCSVCQAERMFKLQVYCLSVHSCLRCLGVSVCVYITGDPGCKKKISIYCLMLFKHCSTWLSHMKEEYPVSILTLRWAGTQTLSLSLYLHTTVKAVTGACITEQD